MNRIGSQLLSLRIDDRFHGILSDQIVTIAEKVLFQGAGDMYKPEIDLFVALLYQYFTFKTQRSPGMRIMRLNFVNMEQSSKRIWYFLLITKWVFERATKVCNSQVCVVPLVILHLYEFTSSILFD